jgi:hypothetical protein
VQHHILLSLLEASAEWPKCFSREPRETESNDLFNSIAACRLAATEFGTILAILIFIQM